MVATARGGVEAGRGGKEGGKEEGRTIAGG